MLKHALLAAAALALAWSSATAPASAADAKPKFFVLYSSAMRSFGYMPEKYVGTNPNGNCKGQNVALPLSWANAPANTKSFAITMVDPAARGGAGFVHWVAYDIPADKKGLKEGEANSDTAFGGGKNGTGKIGWAGPCPSPTDYPHPYTIMLTATDIAPGTLQPGMTRDQLLAALQGHALGVTSFIARAPKP
ncbi:MAG TPA: YbhB/YbcL family Raf kinase inhibitor-like protein [Stellaceae bacterium]